MIFEESAGAIFVFVLSVQVIYLLIIYKVPFRLSIWIGLDGMLARAFFPDSVLVSTRYKDHHLNVMVGRVLVLHRCDIEEVDADVLLDAYSLVFPPINPIITTLFPHLREFSIYAYKGHEEPSHFVCERSGVAYVADRLGLLDEQ